MDKAKGVLKGGWHPSGDPKIHRDTWKSDVKGVVTGKSADKKKLEESRNHQSVPLASLKDPDSFGPPPKHSDAVSGNSVSPISSPARSRPAGGLGGPVPAPRWKQEQQAQAEQPKPPPVPYRTDTTGLSTNNLPKPPARRVDNELAPPPPPPARNAAPATATPTTRTQPPVPPPVRSNAAPIPPPRMNDHPDEYTPPAPPSYGEATQPVPQAAARDPAALNQGALNRLSAAGVSVPGFNIGSSNTANAQQQQSSGIQGHTGQLSELQQRFAKMNTGTSGLASQPPVSSSAVSSAAAGLASAAAAAHKKAPPPPPPKKSGLADGTGSRPSTQDGSAPPPLPLASKPRPP